MLNDIDLKTGLNVIERTAIKVNKTKSIINPTTGLNIHQSVAIQADKTKLIVDSSTRLNIYQSAAIKGAKTKSIVDPSTNLNIHQSVAIKVNKTKSIIDPSTSLNLHQSAAIKATKTKNDPNWKNTIGKESSQKRFKTMYNHQRYGFNNLGQFNTAPALVKAIKRCYGYSPSTSSIQILKKTNFKTTITKGSFARSQFLQSLPENPVGKSYYDLGFYYYEDVKS